jgi:DNA-directed RNA polymerase subunit beta'
VRTSLVDTTVGRALLSGDPAQGPAVLQLMNKALKKKEISKLINASFRQVAD